MQSNIQTSRAQKRFSRLFALLVIASLVLSSIAAVPAPVFAQDEPPAPEVQADLPPAPAAPVDPSRVDFKQIVIKFKPAVDVSLQAEGLVSAAGADLSPLQQALAGQEITPLFSQAPAAMETLRASAAAASSGYTPTLDSFFTTRLADDTTPEQAAVILQSILADPNVETAYMEPLYAGASRLQLDTSFVDDQVYREDAPVGIGANYANDITGGKGTNVMVIDVEAGWQIGHEDLPLKNSDLIESSNSSDLAWVNHGTAVAGVIAGVRNTKGVTGVASDSYFRMVSNVTYLTADAILKAALNARPGDIIVVPLQALGPVSNGNCPDSCDCSAFESIPVEYWPANYEAISYATSLGIIVVESSGNGSMNLDDKRYDSAFSRSYRDSGAILVGAGDSDTHGPVCDANYGKRIDVQGWANNVVTTGYGDLPGGIENPNEYYTATFGGSSAATAMIAGAASSLQGIARKRGYLLTPAQMRSILRSTGTPQGDPTDQPIGPLPDLEKAITEKLSDGVYLEQPEDDSVFRGLRPTFVWQPYLGATQYELQIATNSTFTSLAYDVIQAGTEFTPPANLKTTVLPYFWRVRAYVNDVWLGWGPIVYRVSVSGETAPAVTLSLPAAGYVVTNKESFRPTFTWKLPNPEPDGWNIQISTDYDFSSGIDAFVTTNSYTPAGALAENSKFYWRVRSFLGAAADPDSFGPWTGRRLLYTALDVTHALPLGFADDGNENTLRPTFDWADVDDARSYQVAISLTDTFTKTAVSGVVNPPTDGSTIKSEFVPPSDLGRTKDLFWRVRVKGLYGWSSWSDFDSFTTPNPPGKPTQGVPGDKSVTATWETGTLFTWSKPTGNPGGFQFQLSTTKEFDNIIVDETVGLPDPGDEIKVPNYTVEGLDPENVYYWRVRSIGDDELSSGYSVWSSIRTLYTTPPAPTGLTTDDPATSLRPTFNWDRIDIARSYQLQVAKDNDAVDDKTKLFSGTNIVANATTAFNPPFDLPTSLTRNRTLLWRVRAYGRWGYGAWSEISTVTTPNPPNAPVLSSPGNGANLGNFSPTLIWTASVKISGAAETNATAYTLQISNRSDFTVVDPDNDFFVEYADLPTTPTSFKVPVDLLPKGGIYYWRVRATAGDGDGSNSLWSAVWYFNTPAVVTGTITDAITGDPIPNANVQIAGRALSTNTDSDGVYTFRGLPPADYRLTVSVSGYMRQSVVVGTSYGANRTRNMALAEIPEEGTIRIVLTWGGAPADLDAHLWLPTNNQYHLYDKDGYRGDLDDDAINAALERGDSDAYGPEIISIDSTFLNTYQFAVYMNAAPEQFVGSRAVVQVYDGPTRLAYYTVPESGIGHWWKVFKLDGATRKLITQNTITDSSPAPYK